MPEVELIGDIAHVLARLGRLLRAPARSGVGLAAGCTTW